MPYIKLQIRRGTSANWELSNPILAQGEWALTTDTNFLKLGDGVTHWNDLPIYNTIGPTGDTGPTGNTGPTGTIGATGKYL